MIRFVAYCGYNVSRWKFPAKRREFPTKKNWRNALLPLLLLLWLLGVGGGAGAGCLLLLALLAMFVVPVIVQSY